MTFLRRGSNRGARQTFSVETLVATDPEGPWPLWLLRGEAIGAGEPVGTLDSGPLALIDERGLICWDDGRWSLDWWIRTDEGWRYPSKVRSVRQTVGPTPVIQTLFAVPGGDVIATAYAVQTSSAPAVAVHYTNESPTPVALALALRPIDEQGVGRIDHVKVYDNTISVDGAVCLATDRIPASTVAVSGFAALAPAVERANAEPSSEVSSSDGSAQAAMIFPMPHHSSLRVVLATDGAHRVGGDLPTLEAIEKGWSAHLEQFLTVEVEGSPVGTELTLAARRLATSVRGGSVVRPRGHDGSWSIMADLTVADALLEIGDTNPAAEIVLDALDGDRLLTLSKLERNTAFDSFVRLWQLTRRPELLEAASETLDIPQEALAAATPPPASRVAPSPESTTEAWPVTAARSALDLRSRFVAEVGGELHLLAGFDPAWRGRQIDVRNAVTAAGIVSFSLRWHGTRPALLWHVEPHLGGDENIATVVRVPSLDEVWQSGEADGEALLAAQPV